MLYSVEQIKTGPQDSLNQYLLVNVCYDLRRILVSNHIRGVNRPSNIPLLTTSFSPGTKILLAENLIF